MAPKQTGPPNAAHQLRQLADGMADAHAAIGTAEAAAIETHGQAVTAAREAASARRRDRLALIEERNKRAAHRALSDAEG